MSVSLYFQIILLSMLHISRWSVPTLASLLNFEAWIVLDPRKAETDVILKIPSTGTFKQIHKLYWLFALHSMIIFSPYCWWLFVYLSQTPVVCWELRPQTGSGRRLPHRLPPDRHSNDRASPQCNACKTSLDTGRKILGTPDAYMFGRGGIALF